MPGITAKSVTRPPVNAGPIERSFSADALAARTDIEFEWRGRRYRVPAPEEPADVHFVYLEGLGVGDEAVELVVVRSRGWWESLKGFFIAAEPRVGEWEVEPEPLSTSG